MAKISLHSDSRNTATSVSNVFIDEYMSGANGEFVKIYLYLLRCMNSPDAAISISAMADKFEHTEKDIKRALNYWERMHLLRLEYDDEKNLTGVCFVDSGETPTSAENITPEEEPTPSSVTMDNPVAKPASAKKNAPKQENSSVAPEDSAKKAPEQKQYTVDDIRNFRQNEDVAELIFITERYLGRPLTSTDTNSILYWNDGLGFSLDLIEYLIEYCVSKGHTSIRYIEKVALAWAEANVTTVEQAKQLSNLHSQLYFSVMKAFGISGRNLVASETEMIDKWKNVYEFSSEIILEGCKRTMQSIHQPSFEYTDRILSNWKKANISSLDDIAKFDDAFQKKKSTSASSQTSSTNKNKFNNFSQRSYDYDELEKMLLTTNIH
ncbi:MAG: DnaD domain protein [Roseburia sp.]